MNELTLEWSDKGQNRSYIIQDQFPSKSPNVFRIGRDPQRCDLVFHDRTVSALHVEIFFDNPAQSAFIRNLRESNPPLIDGTKLTQGQQSLRIGSHVRLGKVILTVSALSFGSAQSQALLQKAPTVLPEYGLKCPNLSCGNVLAYKDEILKQGCPWCGFSLAAAQSVLIPPSERNS